MTNCTRYLGLDVHAETITAAIAEGRGHVRSLGKFSSRPEAVRKLIERLGGPRRLKVCYEAGPTGHALCWQLTKLGVDCEVIAPSLIPKKAGVGTFQRFRRPTEMMGYTGLVGDASTLKSPKFTSCRPRPSKFANVMGKLFQPECSFWSTRA